MDDEYWKIIIEDLAMNDLQDGLDWYTRAKIGLGEKFLDEFEVSIDKIKINPYHTSLNYEGYRSASLNKFPFEIIYLINTDKKIVSIIAISHLHRKPSWYRNRR